jgi:hypothetical protein
MALWESIRNWFFREVVCLVCSLARLLLSRRYDFRYIRKPKIWLEVHEDSLYKESNRIFKDLMYKQTITSKFYSTLQKAIVARLLKHQTYTRETSWQSLLSYLIDRKYKRNSQTTPFSNPLLGELTTCLIPFSSFSPSPKLSVKTPTLPKSSTRPHRLKPHRFP